MWLVDMWHFWPCQSFQDASPWKCNTHTNSKTNSPNTWAQSLAANEELIAPVLYGKSQSCLERRQEREQRELFSCSLHGPWLRLNKACCTARPKDSEIAISETWQSTSKRTSKYSFQIFEILYIHFIPRSLLRTPTWILWGLTGEASAQHVSGAGMTSDLQNPNKPQAPSTFEPQVSISHLIYAYMALHCTYICINKFNARSQDPFSTLKRSGCHPAIHEYSGTKVRNIRATR